MSKYLDKDGLIYLWDKIKYYVSEKLVTKVDAVSGKGLSTNDYTTTEKSKLAGIEAGANKYTLPAAASNTLGGVKVAGGASDAEAMGYKAVVTNDKDGCLYSEYPENATTSQAGLMTSAMVTKLNGIETGANKYTLPQAGYAAMGGVYTTSDVTDVVGVTGYSPTPIVDGVPYYKNNTYGAANQSTDGLMTAADKNKLDGIAEGANKYVLPTASSTLGGVKTTSTVTSTSGLTAVPIISGVPYYKNTTYSAATTSANGLMSKDDKAKLDGFSAASAYALKTDITGMYKYKGSVATFSALPASGNVVGDVWNVEAGGMNYVWNGTEWDALGEIFTISRIENTDIDSIVSQ